MNPSPIRAVYFNPRVASADGLRRGHVALRLVGPEAPVEVPAPTRTSARDVVVTAIVAALFAWAMLLFPSGCSRPQPPPPAPGLQAEADALAAAVLLDDLDELGARLLWGRGRVEFWSGLRFLTDPAGALGLTSAGTARPAALASVDANASFHPVPPLAGERAESGTSLHLESTETRARGAWFEAAACPGDLVDVDSTPGAVRGDRAGLPLAGSRMAARLQASSGHEHHHPYPAGAGGSRTDEAGAFPRRIPPL